MFCFFFVTLTFCFQFFLVFVEGGEIFNIIERHEMLCMTLLTG